MAECPFVIMGLQDGLLYFARDDIPARLLDCLSAAEAATGQLGAAWILPFLLGTLLALLIWIVSLRGAVREQTIVFLQRIQRVVREFTEVQRKSDRVRESEERFRRLAENMRDIVWIISLDRARTLFVNGSFERITGRNKQTLYDQPNCLDMVVPADRAEAVASLFRQVLEDYERDAQFRIVRADQSLRWLRCRAFSILKDRVGAHQVGCIAEDITERKHSEEELRQLTGRLMRLQDEERRRMARELHDSTGQALAALQMSLGAVDESAGRLGKKARLALSESVRLVKQCSQEVRTVAYLLHPPLLEELGLVSALRHYLEGFAQRSGIEVALDPDRNFPRLPADTELALFRVVQESLTNIHRHSGSRVAKIRLRRELGSMRLEIEDEGRGMNRSLLDDSGQIRPGVGVGIAGMQERLRQLGGRLEIISGSPGTTVAAIIPMA